MANDHNFSYKFKWVLSLRDTFQTPFFCNFFLLHLSSSLLFLFQSSSKSLKNYCILRNEIPKDSVFSHTSVGYVFSYLLLILQVHPLIFVFQLLHFAATVFDRFQPVVGCIFNKDKFPNIVTIPFSESN